MGAMESAVCVLLSALHIARTATLAGMPVGRYLLGSRTGAQDPTLPLEGLGAVASRRLQLQVSSLESELEWIFRRWWVVHRL